MLFLMKMNFYSPCFPMSLVLHLSHIHFSSMSTATYQDFCQHCFSQTDHHQPHCFSQSDHHQPSTLVVPQTSNSSSPSIPLPLNSHPMITRAKAGITKPKSYNVVCAAADTTILEPRTVKEELSNEHWRTAIQLEYNALMHNHTWSLVPFESHMNVVGNK
ncbi:hypothetical protein ACOSP7_026931 [Xanthoceras sorbifolium]